MSSVLLKRGKNTFAQVIQTRRDREKLAFALQTHKLNNIHMQQYPYSHIHHKHTLALHTHYVRSNAGV